MKIPLRDLQRFFPFCFVTDIEGKIVNAGPSLQKLFRKPLVGSRFGDRFAFQRPLATTFGPDLLKLAGEMIVLDIHGLDIDLMGQIIPAENGGIIFVMNLVVQEAEELTGLGLTFDDFAVQDPIFDFLMLLQTQRRSIREVEIMNRKLEEARSVAENASRMKSQFLANMSHELRTPMNGVLGMASVLLETELAADQRDYLETIVKSGEGMLGLINDILDLSKIEAGHIELAEEEIDLADVVKGVFQTVAVLANKKGLHLRFQIAPGVPTHVRGDAIRLRQILLNLVGNSVKFTEQGEVRLAVTCLEGSEKNVALHFSVVDTGIGMNEDTVRGIFSPFVQGDSSMTKKYEGTGLGLSICKRLVESMSGTIQVQSEVGKGSHFWFTVKLGVAERGTELNDPIILEGKQCA